MSQGLCCRDFLDFLMEYLEGNLSEQEVATFERHMADCPPCEVYLDTYRETVRLGKEALCGEQGPPPEPPEELIQAILAARPRR